MRVLRASVRGALLTAVTVVGATAVWLLALRARLMNTQHDGRPAVLTLWARSVAAILQLRIDADGPRARPPCLVVANHLSYLDIVTLGTLLPAVFVAKTEVGQWPVLGPAVRAAGTLFIDRNNRWRLPSILADIDRVLTTGGMVVVFPEGTSSDGSKVLPFSSASLEPAAAGGYRLFHAAISYRTGAADPPAARAVCWWGDMTLVDHLWSLLHLERIEARVRFGEHSACESDRRVLARDLHAAVATAHAALLDPQAGVGHAGESTGDVVPG